MEVMEAVKMRRSIRKYCPQPVEEEKLAAVLEAARLAPSGRNAQSWKFIVVRDKAKREELTRACNGQSYVGEAPVVIVACALSERIMACGQPAETVDCSIAVSYMTLEACEQGLGTCWIGHFSAGEVKHVLGIPDHVQVVAVLPLGYPEGQPKATPRKQTSEIVSYDQF